MTKRPIEQAAESCVSALDAAIAHGADAPHDEIAHAVRCVIELRNRIIAQSRAGRFDRRHVNQANALVSLAHGAEHPLIGFHLHRLEQTRDGVKALWSSLAGAPDERCAQPGTRQ